VSITGQRGAAGGGPSPEGLADVIDTILDKGLVIDAYVRVSLVGIELVTIDARIVIASVDTYLRFAEAVNRLDISQDKAGITDLAGGGQQGGTAGKAKGRWREQEESSAASPGARNGRPGVRGARRRPEMPMPTGSEQTHG